MTRAAPLAFAAMAAWAIVSACASSPPTFSMDNEKVDATFACPSGSNNKQYLLNASLDAHNPTSKAVTIESMTAQLRLLAIRGPWLQKIGDVFDAGAATFTPQTVKAGANALIKVTIASACTSDKSILAPLSYGEYAVTLHVTTSSGNFTVTSKNRHRIVAT